mgnify:CR=1 FL=1
MVAKGLSLAIGLLPAGQVAAQPWVKKASKAVFTLKTFADDGTPLATSNGFFTDEEGRAVSSYAPFKGAARAIVIDAQDKQLAVDYMLGANETYDVAKFHVATKKTTPLQVAPAKASVGSTVWMLPYHETKGATQATVRKAETFNTLYAYYTLAPAMAEGAAGCPLLNDEGQVVGLMQQPYSSADTLSYAVSANYADSLRMTGLSINDPALRNVHIKKALPDDVGQATLTLYIAGPSLDSVAYATLVNDFIDKFPNHPDGYEYRAQQEASTHRFDAAARDMEKAISVAEKKDDAHYNYSKLIYQKEVYMSDVPYDGWSLSKALDEARQAEQLNPLPIYRHQQAIILYAQKEYEEAFSCYKDIFSSDLRSAELFYEASRCKQMVGDTTAVLALLDSCVALFSRPYLKEAAPYLLARAEARLEASRYREAVADFNDYESLMPTQVGAAFYYFRFQAEQGGRLFQQALNDIDQAIKLQPNSDIYYAEKASLQVRVGLYQEAAETARECIRLSPDYSDGHLFLGLALCLSGQKEEGVKSLQRARELGDQQADELIEKYGK